MTKTRHLHYDYIRVFAMVGIIAVHSLDIVIAQNSGFNHQWWYAYTIGTFIRISLPLFIMISGALLLNGKEESLRHFYSKRLYKIILPLFIYSLIYLFLYKFRWDFFSIHNVLSSIKSTIAGPVYTHFWFVYTIVGLYLISPFIKVMVKNLSDKMLLNLIILIVLLRIINQYLPLTGFTHGFGSTIFDGWFMYFLLGYALTRECFQKYTRTILGFGIISYALTLVILRYYPKASQNIYDLAPTMMLMASALFYFFILNKNWINQRQFGQKTITFLAQYSYAIFLIHYACLNIVNNKLNLTALSFGYYVGYPLTVTVTLIFSIVAAVVIENTITNPVKWVIDFVYMKVKQLIHITSYEHEVPISPETPVSA